MVCILHDKHDQINMVSVDLVLIENSNLLRTMPAAITLAMHFDEPQRLLFESIGFLQDSTFGPTRTDTKVKF